MYPFRQVNVFSTNPLKGNPLAVVECKSAPSDEEMQDFANWTNLSETTFLLPPRSSKADYYVRIFTPQCELPFAGHPTLGTCHVWLESHDQQLAVQECGAGLVTIRKSGDSLMFKALPSTRLPTDKTYLDSVLSAIHVDSSDVVDYVKLVNGPEFTAILLKSDSAVLNAKPDYAKLQIIVQGVVGLCAVRDDGVLEVRSLVSFLGCEDPITGSLNAALAGWLLEAGHITAPYTANQGRCLNREGVINVTKDDEGIWIGGQVHTVIKGQVSL